MEKGKIDKLKKILADSETKDPAIVKKEAKDFLQSVNAEELIQAEQELMDQGVTPAAMSHLCAAHLELMEGDLESIKESLPEGHPIQTLILEHDEILKFLDELEIIKTKVQKADQYSDITKEIFDKLRHITHHLVEAEKHHQREEDVLFPAAEANGIYGPTQIMVTEHVEMRALKKELNQLASEVNEENFNEFKKDFLEASSRLIQHLRDHIFKENNILYPAALSAIPEEEWVKIKKDADAIGYCCFTPKYIEKKEEMSVLDLRNIQPFERHEKIFELWEKIKSGESFKIINDHDPKPLHYQFDAEYKDQFEWKYLEKGPKDWSVIIKKK